MPMSPDRWRQIEALYHGAAEQPDDRRGPWLADTCGGDTELLSEVEALLAQQGPPTTALNRGPGVVAAVGAGGVGMAAGRRLGAYAVVAPIGAGGMGEVYRARDTRLGREVAIKILPHALSADPDRLARFEREARVLAALNHPNIATIHGLEEHDGIKALVMELVAGETLAGWIARAKGGGLPIAEALGIARQIGEALDVAHEKGIVHRDLKPANVKITPEGLVKVLDFGLAKLQAEDTAHPSQAPTVTIGGTREGSILGTAAYMSPEQARGFAVDKRTDIWAFGCVLFEMLTGRAVFARQTVSDTLAAILEREPDWRALPPATPLSVVRLLHRCLEKDPKRRLRDVGDARTDFELAPPESAPPETRGRPRPRYLLWTLLSVAALALGLAAWALARTSPADAAPRIVRAVKVTDTPAQEFGPAISPDGKWIAYYSDVRGVSDVWVKFLDSGATSNLTASLDLELQVRATIGGVDISPDGAQIAFTARQKGEPTFGTWVIPAPVGGQPRKLLTSLQGMRWSPDGKHLVAMRPGSVRGDRLFVADADGTNDRVIVPLSGGRHVHWPAWSRDGAFIYFICTFMPTQDEPTELCRVPSVGGTVEGVIATERRAQNAAPAPDGGLLFSANPTSLDAGLWWRPKNGGDAVPLTGGIGEYVDTYVSNDGRRAVSTWLDVRQSLIEIPVRSGGAIRWRQLTEGYSGEMYPQLDPAGRRLAFSSTRGGARTLWLARPDATQASPLTGGAAIDDRPAFSPDGNRIAFVSSRAGKQAIWIVSSDGGTPQRVGEAIALDTLSWSPDGERIVFATPGDPLPRLVSMSVDDGGVEPFEGVSGHAPSWSTSTKRLAYLAFEDPPEISPAVRTTLAIVDGGQHRRYPIAELPQGFSNGLTAWSPDGRRIALVAAQANLRNTIWIFDPAARDQFRQLIELPVTVRVRGITWSPDGSSVIVGQQETKSDIVLFDLANVGR
jgi:serine/threonine protein kinase/Tol biopolymer transport system component